MGLTLAEKHPWTPFPSGSSSCDLDGPSTSGDDEFGDDPVALPLGQLLTATGLLMAATILLWTSLGALKWSLRYLPRRLLDRYWHTHGAKVKDDEDQPMCLHDSPLTPPPVEWLRDADSAGPAFMTPPSEPMLFSVSPPLFGTRTTSQQAMPYGSYLAGGITSGYQRVTKPPSGGGGPGSGSSDGVQQQRGGTGRGRGGGGGSSGGGSKAVCGWDRAWLARQSVLMPAISSVEGLAADPVFLEYLRSRRGRSPTLERGQSQAKVHMYKEMRRLDPDAFRRLLSRQDIMTYEVRTPPVALVILDYLLATLVVPLGLVVLARSQADADWPLLRYVPVIVWVIGKLWLAAGGHTSLLGRMLGLYLVYDTKEDEAYGNAWEGMAGLGGHILLVLFELSMAALSAGGLAVGAVLSVLVGSRRQTLAMRLLGLRLEQELCRPTKLSQFSPVASDASTPVPTPAGHLSYEAVPAGRYGICS